MNARRAFLLFLSMVLLTTVTAVVIWQPWQEKEITRNDSIFILWLPTICMWAAVGVMVWRSPFVCVGYQRTLGFWLGAITVDMYWAALVFAGVISETGSVVRPEIFASTGLLVVCVLEAHNAFRVVQPET